jgi:hypothetical protein
MKRSTKPRLLLLAWAVLPGLCLAGAIRGKVTLAGAAPDPRKVEVTIDHNKCGK